MKQVNRKNETKSEIENKKCNNTTNTHTRSPAASSVPHPTPPPQPTTPTRLHTLPTQTNPTLIGTASPNPRTSYPRLPFLAPLSPNKLPHTTTTTSALPHSRSSESPPLFALPTNPGTFACLPVPVPPNPTPQKPNWPAVITKNSKPT